MKRTIQAAAALALASLLLASAIQNHDDQPVPEPSPSPVQCGRVGHIYHSVRCPHGTVEL